MISVMIWIGWALLVLGVGGGIATTAFTAFIPAVFGLALLGLGRLARNPERTSLATLFGLAVAALGALGAIANIARLFGAGAFGLNAATFSNVVMMGICGSLLLFWLVQQVTGTELLKD